jgi:activator of HSP90 ATPase
MILNIIFSRGSIQDEPGKSPKNIRGITMSARENSEIHAGTTTRRRIIALAAIAFGGLAADSRLWGQQAMQEKPSTTANQTRTSLHQDIQIKTAPQHVYEALLDSKQFTTFSGAPADIDPKVGGAFSMFGGLIVGRNVEMVANQRIVQAWRPTHWDPGIYSIVRFELKPDGAGTSVALDHTGFPEGEFDHLDSGWHAHYWEPLKKFFA